MSQQHEHLSDELARILMQRIRKALDKARYTPADVRDTEAAAREVVRPYLTPARRESEEARSDG